MSLFVFVVRGSQAGETSDTSLMRQQACHDNIVDMANPVQLIVAGLEV